MAPDQPDTPLTTPADQGSDLFFGEEPEEVASPPAEEAAPEAAAADEGLGLAETDSGSPPIDDASAVQTNPAVAAASVDAPASPAMSPVATVASLPVVETNGTAPAASAPPAAPPPPAPAAKPSSSNGCLQSLGAMLLGALLGVVVTLAILFALNQDLRFAPRTQVDDAQRTISTLGANADTLQADVTGLQGDLAALHDRTGQLQEDAVALQGTLAQQGEVQSVQAAALEQLSGNAAAMGEQISGLQTQAETQAQALLGVQTLAQQTGEQVAGIQTAVDTVQENLDVMATAVNTLTVRVDDLAVSTQRSERFMRGMRDLLALVYGEAITPTGALTGTAPLTATAVITETAAPTATLSITPTAIITATPAITGTEAITGTPVVTTTPTITTTPTVTATVPLTVPKATPAGTGSIAGSVFLDADRDGRRNPTAERGLANVRVTLYDRNRVELARALTNARGSYSFADLAPGIYIVVATDPPGYVSTSPNILTVVLRSGATASGIDFGDALPQK